MKGRCVESIDKIECTKVHSASKIFEKFEDIHGVNNIKTEKQRKKKETQDQIIS